MLDEAERIEVASSHRQEMQLGCQLEAAVHIIVAERLTLSSCLCNASVTS